MAMPKLIFLGGFACPYQIAQRLVRRIRNPDWRQFPSPVTACQLLGLPPVGLHPVSAFVGISEGAATSHATPSWLHNSTSTCRSVPACRSSFVSIPAGLGWSLSCELHH